MAFEYETASLQDKGFASSKQGSISTAQLPGPFGHASHTFDRVTELTRRVGLLADRLVGPTVKANGQDDGQSRLVNGVFDALDVTCEHIDNEIAAANEALSRIEKALP